MDGGGLVHQSAGYIRGYMIVAANAQGLAARDGGASVPRRAAAPKVISGRTIEQTADLDGAAQCRRDLGEIGCNHVIT